MSRFFSSRYDKLTPYTPGEQPQDRRYIKLNTNESPYPPSPLAIEMAREEAGKLQLYSDPECRSLKRAAAEILGFSEDELIFTNGSDEILNFAFMAFCDDSHPAAFADITYGFYPVFAALNSVPYREIPLREDFTLDPADYIGTNETLFIANPNAPTGRELPMEKLKEIIASNPGRIVVVDEAYVDFGGESAAPLVREYDNLLVTRTFSKSRSLAGARLGFGIACPELIRDLETIRYSTNPYNINRLTQAAGLAALENDAYFMDNCRKIIDTREHVTKELREMGFFVTDSRTNFVFARSDKIGGAELYEALKARGVLVRHFSNPHINEFNRITIGSREEMDIFLEKVREILSEKGA